MTYTKSPGQKDVYVEPQFFCENIPLIQHLEALQKNPNIKQAIGVSFGHLTTWIIKFNYALSV